MYYFMAFLAADNFILPMSPGRMLVKVNCKTSLFGLFTFEGVGKI